MIQNTLFFFFFFYNSIVILKGIHIKDSQHDIYANIYM